MGPFYAEMDPAIILDKNAKMSEMAKGSGCKIWSFNETPETVMLKIEVVQMLSGGMEYLSKQLIAARTKLSRPVRNAS